MDIYQGWLFPTVQNYSAQNEVGVLRNVLARFAVQPETRMLYLTRVVYSSCLKEDGYKEKSRWEEHVDKCLPINTEEKLRLIITSEYDQVSHKKTTFL
ncbi:unnamed protein product [Caretta caretta]